MCVGVYNLKLNSVLPVVPILGVTPTYSTYHPVLYPLTFVCYSYLLM